MYFSDFIFLLSLDYLFNPPIRHWIVLDSKFSYIISLYVSRRYNVVGRLWKIQSPLKFKMLLWNLAHEILLVGFVLHSKIPSFSACHRCLHVSETHLHTFRDYPNSAMLWTEILSSDILPLNFDLVKFRNLPWQDWLLYQFKFTGSWLTTFITCIWHLWRCRNKAVFEGSVGIYSLV